MLSQRAVAGVVLWSILSLFLVLSAIYGIWFRRRSHRRGDYHIRPLNGAFEWEDFASPEESYSLVEPLNSGSMQVKGIAEVGGGKERQVEF